MKGIRDRIILSIFISGTGNNEGDREKGRKGEHEENGRTEEIPPLKGVRGM
jgi:hypothetical protein